MRRLCLNSHGARLLKQCSIPKGHMVPRQAYQCFHRGVLSRRGQPIYEAEGFRSSQITGTNRRSISYASYESDAVLPTVYALSTPPGKSAIAVIRITGSLCKHIYHSLCPSRPLPKPRLATLRSLHHPEDQTNILDPSSLVLFFPAPNSFTGEDLLELHIHGGPAVIKSILSALPKCPHPPPSPQSPHLTHPKILPAEPGSFTLRAFHNSRLSIPEIEALSTLLTAETEHQRSLSVSSTTRGASDLSKLYTSWHIQLLSARGELEALIDFSEDQQFEDTPAKLLGNVTSLVKGLRGQMKRYLGQAVKGELVREGINLALLGAPNAGKSSLLNRVVGREAVIVSGRAGTTRDVVDVVVDVGGWMVVLGDTAGFRGFQTNGNDEGGGFEGGGTAGEVGEFGGVDEIEVEGMKRARARIMGSDVVIFLMAIEEVDGELQLKVEDSALEVANGALEAGKELLVVVNKMDKLKNEKVPGYLDSQLRDMLPAYKGPVVGISCTDEQYEATIQTLLHSLTDIFSRMTSAEAGFEEGSEDDSSLGGIWKNVWSDAIGASSRQKALVEECYRHLEDFLGGLDQHEEEGEDIGEDIDIVLKAETLRRAADCLGRIMGRGEGASSVEEVLGVVFEKFCVGK